MIFTFWNYYVLKLLRLETIMFSDATLSDINVVLCYVLSKYHFNSLELPHARFPVFFKILCVTAQQSCGPGGEGSLAYERYLGRQLQGFEEDVVSLQNILMSSG